MIAWLATEKKLGRTCQEKQICSLKDHGSPTRDKIANPSPKSAILFYNLPSSSERD